MTDPGRRLEVAARLIDEATSDTVHLWPRAAALLIRQALEGAVLERLSQRATLEADAPFTAQLHCLHAVVDADTARSIAYVWSATSAATHHAGYELPPTRAALIAWLDAVRAALPRLAPPEAR